MHSEMITAREGALTVVTLEWPISGVFAVMSRQFIRSCEPPLAARPRTRVWPFTSVRSYMNAQVRQLGVVFGAAGVRTDVQGRRAAGRSSSPERCQSWSDNWRYRIRPAAVSVWRHWFHIISWRVCSVVDCIHRNTTVGQRRQRHVAHQSDCAVRVDVTKRRKNFLIGLAISSWTEHDCPTVREGIVVGRPR